jgi:hypothetical protein
MMLAISGIEEALTVLSTISTAVMWIVFVWLAITRPLCLLNGQVRWSGSPGTMEATRCGPRRHAAPNRVSSSSQP